MKTLTKPMISALKHTRWFPTAVVQILLVIGGYGLAFGLRFDFRLPTEYTQMMLVSLPLLLVCRMAVYTYYKLNSGWWRFVSMVDLINLTKAVIAGTGCFLIGLGFVLGLEGFPRSVIVLEAVLNFMLLGGVRFGVRWFREALVKKEPKQFTYALIVGAGNAGTQLLNEIRINSHLGIRVVGFIDDDERKRNAYIQGVQVLGSRKDIPQIVKKYDVDEALIAIPSASRKRIASIVRTARSCGIKVRILPSLLKLIENDGLWSQLREVPYDELLGRPIVKFRRETDLTLLKKEIRGKTVLVTGAAGSIGRELSYQTAALKPHELILYERDENGLYFVELELKERFPDCKITPVVGDILNRQKFNELVARDHVDLIYHAAAYKHVPMMQREPFEAVRNNIFVTKIVAEAVLANNVEKCVFLSTDKAVKPTSIMGATKRIGEMILQGYSGDGSKFIIVRFGNVIGSNGSVLQLFKKQIAHGGPVTVTHAEASRYFMSISEAVQLVMTAGAMGQGGEIYLLDMGEPIKITDLARKLIEASGLTPGKDIEIKYIGLRPGEKLTEELFWKGENIMPTQNKKITRLKSNGFNKDLFFMQLNRLQSFVRDQNDHELIETLNDLVPEATFSNGKKNGHSVVRTKSTHKPTEKKMTFVEN
ncbi:polysaccharide biosynthesis protein [candidate division KSB1 bacterium]|nr:polysaccharide biosynthesis protein [candidate division KSB1 bacterium]NIR69185.1 polysaccharide biosynthesis protein [candidate division KSB1 bacterium]NIS25696.1 polysaccharide biosynthesis protein [candidate division KSB1 bacterium]NIT72564.1 polysaccharide biosynthesis protein [candidate division KSB1 bacterium]NIU26373.1 polysaccharide biosynthesis protein [candidate division KSB1 bacterium]